MKKKYFITFIFISVIVLIMIVISYLYISYIQKLTDENTLKNLGELTKQDAVKIKNQIIQHKKILENIVNQVEKQDKITEKEIFNLYNENIANQEFSRLGIMYENGKTITSDNKEIDLSEDIDKFFNEDTLQISKSRKSKIDEEEINIYSKKTRINGKNIVILLVLETEKYEEIFAESIYNGKGYEYIINSSGEIIANSAKRENGYNLFNIIQTLKDNYNSKKLEEMKKQIKEYKNGQVKFNVSNKYYYTSYNYLNVNDWFLVILTPGSIVSQEYNRVLKITFVTSIIINIVILITTIYIIYSNKKKKEKLYKLAYIDNLTGLGNNNYFIERGTELLGTQNTRCYLIIIDFDKFKVFNKKYGREEGDLLLKAFSQKLKNVFGENQIITRLTNDIFSILIKEDSKNINKKKAQIVISEKSTENKFREIEDVLENICNELSNITIDKIEYKILISMGIYEIKGNEKDIYETIDKALLAHSMAKGNYNKKFYIFNEDLENKMIKEHDIESIMEEGIQNKEFKIFYQPKFNSKTEKIEGAEALVRWERNEKLIPPNEFIPIFEKNKFIIKLDKYIFEEVCKDIKEWKDKYNRKIKISVNISKEHLLEKNFLEDYCKIANKYELKPNDLEIEITESAAIDENFDIIEILNKMKNLGFSIAIDDFGTGYSSLNMLQNMPIDVIKIDKSFINQSKMLETIMIIVRKMNLQTVAEGVETLEQVLRLRDLGVDLLQGYYFSKPVDKLSFEKYFKN